jgi:hypothetical protein
VALQSRFTPHAAIRTPRLEDPTVWSRASLRAFMTVGRGPRLRMSTALGRFSTEATAESRRGTLEGTLDFPTTPSANRPSVPLYASRLSRGALGQGDPRSSRAGKRSWGIYGHPRWDRFLDGILAENGLDDLSMASWWNPRCSRQHPRLNGLDAVIAQKPTQQRGPEATSDGASVLLDRSAQDRSKAWLDEVVRTPVARLSGRAASRATNAYAVRAAEIVPTQ